VLTFPVDLPFTCFSAHLPPDPTSEELLQLYIALHTQASNAYDEYDRDRAISSPVSPDDAPARSPLSYNLALTNNSMVVCPRRAEGSMISLNTDQPQLVGPISLNGTLLAGTLLVKKEEEWNTLKSNPSQLESVLNAIGIPSTRSTDGKL
jgi:ATP adenylyltransferase